MNRFTTLIAVAALASAASLAASAQTVGQVTTDLHLTDGAELHITSTEPFATTGSVDIIDTRHAVVFFDSLRPTEARKWLSKVTVNGVPATETGTANCQLRLYDHGTLLYPYGKEGKGADGFHPLTVYSGQYCQGDSCDRFGTENTDGYMNSLGDSTLNNRIRSFRLKRGYMVTFAIQKEGWGYQHCFIADKEDLVVDTLPDILDCRISSYRVFRWNNVGKNGVANILDNAKLKKLNCTWTYAWGPGRSLGSDYECVPHMNNLWSATTHDLGANDQSPYLKTDNEPANGNDPSPATVAQELQRWPDLMRTGRRLLSPSSFDSGEWWHKAFLDSIDARGWRCDIVDIHCYWNENSFDGIKSNWVDKFHRPVWITEFIWGASWSGGFGIFDICKTDEERNNPSDEALQKNREVLSRIWTKLNSWDYVERYAYWNDEWPCSKLLRGDQLTPAGEYYAQMKTGPSYTGAYDYTPRPWRLQSADDLRADYVAATGRCHVAFTNYNGDLSETVTLQRRVGAGEWEDVATWMRPDDHTLSFDEPLPEGVTYTYRVVETTYKHTTLTSGSKSVNATILTTYHEPGTDMTSRMANADFEGGKTWTDNWYDTPTSWLMTLNTSGGSEFYVKNSGGYDGGKYYNLWAARITEADVHQSVSLPVGHYTLTAKIKAGPDHGQQQVYAQVGGIRFTASPTKNNQWEDVTVAFFVPEDGSVTVGAAVHGDGTNGNGWMNVDDFTLAYAAPAVATVAAMAGDVDTAWPYASWEKRKTLESALAVDESGDNGAAALKALREVALSHAVAEGVAGREDMTTRIAGADFEKTMNAWKRRNISAALRQTNGICLPDGTMDVNFATTNSAFWDGSAARAYYKQDVTGLPAGCYQLSVFVRGDLQPDVRLMAQTAQSDVLPAAGQDEGSGVFNYGWQLVSFVFTNDATHDVTIGLTAYSREPHNWVNFDRFQLVRLGDTLPTSITPVTAQPTPAVSGCYDLSGRKVAAPAHRGVYIMDGKKMVVK